MRSIKNEHVAVSLFFHTMADGLGAGEMSEISPGFIGRSTLGCYEYVGE